MMQLPQKLRSEIYIWSLCIISFALPLSVFLISVGQIIIFLNWLTGNDWRLKWARLKENPSIGIIGLFYLVHLLWLFNTSDFGYAAHDLKIKLPFLIIPLVVGTSERLSSKAVKRVIIAFCTGVFLSSIYSAFNIYIANGDHVALGKQISPFVSHIRLALMVDFAVVALLWLYTSFSKSKLRFGFLLLALWFCSFLLLLQSLTGVVVLLILAGIYIIVTAVRSKLLMAKWFLAISVVLITLLPSTYLIHAYTRNFTPLPVDSTLLEKYTLNGNPYHHEVRSKYLENGNHTYLYICENELKKAWEKRSLVNYDSLDREGMQIKYTIFRYMTSKGLRKDSAGIAHLSDKDIKHIENGVASSIYVKKAGIESRVYRVMWELYHYKQGADPSGYSVAQRLEYLKTALHIIDRNFWVGTGTGDVVQSFKQQYELDKSRLTPQWRLRAHNQYITFFLTFGLTGFLIIMASLFIPPILEKRYTDFLFLSFFIIFVLSMLNEDTLETHAGISFIALFYAVLLFPKTDDSPLIVGKKNVQVS